MPNDQTDAIVLRTTNFADQDKIVVFFSPDRGLLRGIAKGARKFGNRFGCSLEPMSVVRVFYHEKERRDLVTVASCDLVESFFDVQKDPETAFLLTYFAELIEEFAPARAAEDVLYRLLLAVLRCLGQGGDRAFLAAYFEAWFLQANGLLPDLAGCRACRKPLAGLALAQEGRRLLPGLRPGQERGITARDLGLRPLGPQEPAARASAATRSRRTRSPASARPSSP
jgi:DNA repair protein RecO (recombination protein O)